jgi:hypothetical protein
VRDKIAAHLRDARHIQGKQLAHDGTVVSGHRPMAQRSG